MASDSALERRVLALFQEALALPEREREAWIESHSDVDSDLRTRLKAMLTADRVASLRTGGAADVVADDRIPEKIGAYKITGRIGRGGMGAVYRGERDTGDFAHTAAIKLIKPGLLSERLIERFQRERQTLANLEHPYIARLYDGGETAEGAPYFVMEFIDGLPILDWADEQALSRDARLALFTHICEAVAHAHRNLIVHRDITPSNILVTREGVVKLIDFGIAKPAADEADRERTTPGSIASLSLTPGYAAPERMTGGEATTSGDVYSLGKLLEALVEADLTDPELAAIIAKASALAPADRYPTVDALRSDVEAARGGLPVAAIQGGRRYLVRKFVARHRLGVAASALGLLLLIGALALALIANIRAQTAREEAEHRFGELRSLAGYMVFDLNDKLARTVGNAEARQSLVGRAQTYLTALAVTPNAPADIKLEAARGLTSLARIQGVPKAPNFGKHELARRNLNKALTLLNSPLLDPKTAAPEKAEALTARAMIEANEDTDIKAATASVNLADAALKSVAVAERSDRWHLAQGGMRIAQLEIATHDQDFAALTRLPNILVAEVNRWPTDLRQSRSARTFRALADYYRGVRTYFNDDLVPSIAFLQSSERAFEQLDREQPNDPNLLYDYLWVTYFGYGSASGLVEKTPEADAFLSKTRQTVDRLISLEPSDKSLLGFKSSVEAAEAQSLSSKGRYREAVAKQQAVVDLLTQALGPTRKARELNRLGGALFVLGNIATEAANKDLACDSYRTAQAVLIELDKRKLSIASGGARNKDVIARNVQRCATGAPLSEFEGE